MRRRVDARRYPTIIGELAAMKETDGDGRYLVTGDVSFRGVTREYQGQMTLSTPDERTISLEGERVFDIREFGMSPPRILMFQIYPEVAVKVRIVAEQEE
jgi:polyisoprenoid-binding protein YceI